MGASLLHLWREKRWDKFDVGGSGRVGCVPLQSASQFVGASRVCDVFS